MAAGPATITPQPVPELIADQARFRRSSGMSEAMSAYGGNANPAEEPATSTPSANWVVVADMAISAIPPPAVPMASATAARGPALAVRGTTRAFDRR